MMILARLSTRVSDELSAHFKRELETTRDVFVLHSSVRGRVRLKVRGLARPQVRNRIVALLESLPEVDSFRLSDLTETVLITHTSSVEAEYFVAAFQNPTSPQMNSKGAARKDAIFNKLTAWHALLLEQVLLETNTSGERGLTDAEAAKRRLIYGRNELRVAVERPFVIVLLKQFRNTPVLLLLGSAALSAAMGSVGDAIVISVVVVLNAGIGAYTEYQAERTIRGLSGQQNYYVKVMRGGTERSVLDSELVVGDFLKLGPGKVPADLRILTAEDLSVDESALTGESMPVFKSDLASRAVNTPIGARSNMLFRGTTISSGTCSGIVVATGAQTELGQIQTLIALSRSPETPLQRELRELGKRAALGASLVCGAVFAIGLLRGNDLVSMLKTSLSLAVASIPEGLPTVATTVLALGVRKMEGHHVVVRDLTALEALGAIETLCLDKTGTLTQNKMRAVELFLGQHHMRLQDHPPQGTEESPALARLMLVASLCNDAQIILKPDKVTYSGSATETALLEMAVTFGFDVEGVRKRHASLKTTGRSHGRRLMSTLSKSSDGKRLLSIKGSPRDVLKKCRWYLDGHELRELGVEDRHLIKRQNDEFAARTFRVLGFAFREFSNDFEPVEKDLVWLGLVAMTDPPREGVEDMIRVLHEAGIDTVMMTGDQAATASAIATKLGFNGRGVPSVVDAKKLANMSQDELEKVSDETHIFSRVSPSEKLRIVQSYQTRHRLVAMTGDGINDGPALRAADVGIAMGLNDNGVATEAAKIVLATDNLSDIVTAIGEGRSLRINLRRAVHYLLSTNLSEVLVTLISVVFGKGEPLNPMQLLWINLLTDVFPDLALAVEPSHSNVLRKTPLEVGGNLINKSEVKLISREAIALSAGTLVSYLVAVRKYGQGHKASTVAFHSLAAGQLLHAISNRSQHFSVFSEDKLPDNPVLRKTLVAGFLLELATVAHGGVRQLLGMESVESKDLAIIALGAGIPFVFNESKKTGRRAIGRDRGPYQNIHWQRVSPSTAVH